MDGLAIERQREDCERLVQREGWTVVETYVDQSISATDATKKRPGYDRMVADYEAGMFDAIVCWDLDRLTRQPRQLEDWIDAARTRGLLLKSVSGDVDLTNENGLLIAGIKIQVARAEVVRKGKRQSAAQKQRARMGRAPKGMRPLGYAINGDVIPEEAEAVRAIYALFTKAEHPESLRSLARALSGTSPVAGVPALPKHSHTVSIEREAARRRRAEEERRPYVPREIAPDGPWSPSTVLGILRNPRYAAMSTYTPAEYQADGGRRRSWRAQIVRDDAGEPVRGQWEAIVDDETWWKAQHILDDEQRVTNTSGSTKRKHLGSGLYRCGICDGKVTGASRGYRCAGHVMRSGAAIDEYVTLVIGKRLSRKDARKRVLAPEDGPQARGSTPRSASSEPASCAPSPTTTPRSSRAATSSECAAPLRPASRSWRPRNCSRGAEAPSHPSWASPTPPRPSRRRRWTCAARSSTRWRPSRCFRSRGGAGGSILTRSSSTGRSDAEAADSA